MTPSRLSGVLILTFGLTLVRLAADPLEDPRIKLSGGSGSQGVTTAPFSFQLNDQGGGIFFFCNDSVSTCPGDGDPTHPDDLLTANFTSSAVNSIPGTPGDPFFNLSLTTVFPPEGGVFNCESDLFAFCTFARNGDLIN